MKEFVVMFFVVGKARPYYDVVHAENEDKAIDIIIHKHKDEKILFIGEPIEQYPRLNEVKEQSE